MVYLLNFVIHLFMTYIQRALVINQTSCNKKKRYRLYHAINWLSVFAGIIINNLFEMRLYS